MLQTPRQLETGDPSHITREVLWEGGTSSIYVPQHARIGYFGGGASRTPFLYFHRTGGVRVHIHSREDVHQLRGLKVQGRLQVWEKTEGGVTSRYIDFKDAVPRVSAEHRSTHRWKLCPADDLPNVRWTNVTLINIAEQQLIIIEPKP